MTTMSYPEKLYHFGKSQHISDFVPQGHISFGLADGFNRGELTMGQQDDEMKRTAHHRQKRSTFSSDGNWMMRVLYKISPLSRLDSVFEFHTS